MIDIEDVMTKYDLAFQNFLKLSKIQDLDFNKYETRLRNKTKPFLRREVKKLNKYINLLNEISSKFPNYQLDEWWVKNDIYLEIEYANWTFFITFEPKNSYSFKSNCHEVTFEVTVNVA